MNICCVGVGTSGCEQNERGQKKTIDLDPQKMSLMMTIKCGIICGSQKLAKNWAYGRIRQACQLTKFWFVAILNFSFSGLTSSASFRCSSDRRGEDANAFFYFISARDLECLFIRKNQKLAVTSQQREETE